jgi:DNA-binding LytR/AlgR family response regulator
MVIAATIAQYLKELEYEVVGDATNYTDAITLVESTNPDLVLVDVRLTGQKDGIELAKHIRDNYESAVVFLTANGDKTTLQRAKEALPLAFILKPFSKEDLHTAIEIAMANYISNQERNDQDTVVFKSGKQLFKCVIQEIMYIQSHGNYSQVSLVTGKKLLLRSPLKDIFSQLPADKFAYLSRFVIANVQFIHNISLDKVSIGDQSFDVSLKMRKDVITLWERMHDI